MYALLENGNIRCGDPVRDGENGIRGSVIVDLPPSDPDYEKCIPFLRLNERGRAKRILSDAQKALAVK